MTRKEAEQLDKEYLEYIFKKYGSSPTVRKFNSIFEHCPLVDLESYIRDNISKLNEEQLSEVAFTLFQKLERGVGA